MDGWARQPGFSVRVETVAARIADAVKGRGRRSPDRQGITPWTIVADDLIAGVRVRDPDRKRRRAGLVTRTSIRMWRGTTASIPRSPLLIVILAGMVLGIGCLSIANTIMQPRRTTPVYDPPVLAGQQLWGACSGGFYARHEQTVVLTSTGHCTTEGTVAYDADGTTVRGVFGPAARDVTCPYPGHICASSDLNYLVVAKDRIPWGHLNVVDLGTAGYRVIPSGMRPLGCADIAIGDLVEIDGRGIYRSGAVVEKGDNLHPEDAAYFPCMVGAHIQVGVGDSGGAVVVRGIPAGVTSRSFGGSLGFTPLAEGLAQLELELCTTPDCGLGSPAGDPIETDK